MRVLGSQVGQFVARRQAEDEVRASESRLRAMLEAALDAVVTMDHRGRVLGWNHAAEAIFGYRARRGDRPRHGGADRAAGAARGAPQAGSRASSRPSIPSILDRRLELTGMHKNGTEFPVELTITRIGAPGPPDVHRLPARHHRPQAGRGASCARRALGSSRSPTRSGGGSSATSTTARSSGSPRCCSPSAGCAESPAERDDAARHRDRRARRRACRRSASSRAACIRRCSPSAGSTRRSRRSRSGRRSRRARGAARPSDCRSRSRPQRTTSSRRRSPTCRSTPARSRVVVAARARRADALLVEVARRRRRRRGPRATGCAGSPTASRRSAGRSTLDSPTAAERACSRGCRRLTTLDGRAPPTDRLTRRPQLR